MKKITCLSIIVALFTFTSMAQTQIATIDGIYVERDTVDKKNKPITESFRINEKSVMDGDVLVFDIPGFGDYLEQSNLSVSDVTLLIDEIPLAEIPAIIENIESGVVRFEFVHEDLSDEHRQQIYNRQGSSIKRLRLGIKVGEENAIYFAPKGEFYFGEISVWETAGLILLIVFVLGFGTVIIVFPTILRESIPEQFRAAFAAMVKPEIEKMLPPSSADSDDSTLPATNEDSKMQKLLAKYKMQNFIELSQIKLAYSFSKSQLMFWTLIILSSFIYIWTMTNDINPLNSTALILLGISSATSAAGALVANKQATEAANAPQLQAPAGGQLLLPKSVTAFLESRVTNRLWITDVLSDNQGISIHRVQSFAFNIIYGVIFLKSVVLDYAMPSFGEVELLLLGVSNGTYTFLKSSETK